MWFCFIKTPVNLETVFKVNDIIERYRSVLVGCVVAGGGWAGGGAGAGSTAVSVATGRGPSFVVTINIIMLCYGQQHA